MPKLIDIVLITERGARAFDQYLDLMTKKINTKKRTYLYGGDLADEDEGHHDSKTKTKATQASSQSKWGERLAGKTTIRSSHLTWTDYHLM